MSPDLYTFIAHRGLPFANPLSEEIVGRALQLLALRQTDRVVDFGSGFCELPIRIVETYGAICDAVELSPRIAAAARVRIGHRLGERGLADQLRLHEGDAGAFRAQLTPGEFACSVCIGSTHAIGGFDNACRVLSRLSRAGGVVLLGEGYWRTDPPRQFIEATGIPADELSTLPGLLATAAAHGLHPLWVRPASEADWDEYEWAHARAIETFAADHPNDPDAAAMLARSRHWRDCYVKWGRAAMGFALMIFRVDPVRAG